MAPDLDMDLAAVYAMLARPQTCIFCHIFFPLAVSLLRLIQITSHTAPTPVWWVLAWVPQRTLR